MKKILLATAVIFLILIVFYAGVKATTISPELFELTPALEVTPNPYLFDDTYVGETSSVNFTFSNTGTEPLDISDITFTDPAFSIDYTSFTIQPGDSGELPVNFTPGSQGFFEGTMQIFSNDPVNNPYGVELSGNGVVELIDGWQWIETGFDYILMDIEFPEGQNQVGYAIGQTQTYNGDGIVIKTTDGGFTWTQLTPDGIPGLEEMSFIDMQTGYAAGWDDYVIKTTDGGATWDTLTVASGMWEITDIEFYDENHGIVMEGPNVYITEDGGDTWTSGTALDNSGYMVDYLNANTLVAVGNENYIYKSTDGGYNWTVKNSGFIGELLLGVHFLNETYGMAAGDYGYIYTTTDGGETWTSDQQVGDQLLHAPFIWDEDTAWVAGTPEMVFKTTDGGTIWNSAYSGNWQKAFYRITFTDNYTGFICGGSGGIVLRKEGFEEIPAINVTPDAIAFEDTYVEETATEVLIVSNTGFAILEVTGIESTNDVFTVDMIAFTIEPGGNQEITVMFAPDDEGFFEGVLQIANNDPENSTFEVAVSGNGLIAYPSIVVEPQEIVFDTTLVDETSTEIINISNSGIATLNVSDIVSSNSVFTVNLTSFDIAPNESLDIEVTFAPTEQMMFEGTLQIESNDPNGTIEVALSGYGDIDTYIGDLNSKISIKIYPNPVKDILYIDHVEDKEIYIYDLLGNIKVNLTSTSGIEMISVSEFSSGIYLIKIVGKEGIITKKFEVSR